MFVECFVCRFISVDSVVSFLGLENVPAPLPCLMVNAGLCDYKKKNVPTRDQRW